MRRFLLALAVITLVAGPDTVWSQDEIEPNFTGTWILNQDLSDSFQPQRPSNGSAQGGRRGGGGRGGGRGRGGGMEPGAGDRRPAAQDTKRAARLKQAVSRLEIFHAGPELNITSGLEISRLFYTDGRSTTILTDRGEATASAQWEGATLKILSQNGNGGPSRQLSYTLSAEGQRLTVTESRTGPGSDKSQEMKRVYDKQE